MRNDAETPLKWFKTSDNFYITSLPPTLRAWGWFPGVVPILEGVCSVDTPPEASLSILFFAPRLRCRAMETLLREIPSAVTKGGTLSLTRAIYIVCARCAKNMSFIIFVYVCENIFVLQKF